MEFRLFSFRRVALSLLVLGIALITLRNWQSDKRDSIIGNIDTFNIAYARWRAEAERNGQRTKLVLALGYIPGLSSELIDARGNATIDLAQGVISVEVWGLADHREYEVWLVHNQPGPGRSVKPERGDRMIRAGTLAFTGGRSKLETSLSVGALSGFKLDLLVITRFGQNPLTGGLLYGTPSVFQKIYYSDSQAHRLIFTSFISSRSSGHLNSLLETPFRSLVSRRAYAQQISDHSDLISMGEKLFFEEKFHGNGRTCSTCHPADNNFTLDPAYIATLPKNDPLFVAEFDKDLNSQQNGGSFFEVPQLMRQRGLILENSDGFDDLKTKFVLRAVPHLQALALSIKPARALDGTSSQVLQRTGWGGDGARGASTLKQFALQAVVQHFTRTLNRIPDVDFRLPTDAELDAIEAFLLSLGRPDELNFSTLNLKDTNAGEGLRLFNNEVGKCSLCHFNGGANHSIAGFGLPGTQNANFNNGLEAAATHPIIAPGLALPRDGGFGTDPSGTFTNVANPDGSFGNGTFSTPSIIEAADSPPFFHNNLVDTIEEAVGFYNLASFNNSPAAKMAEIGPISLTISDVNQIAAFLRVINALDNIRSAQAKLTNALAAPNSPRIKKLLELAIVDIQDAVRVLRESVFSLNPDAQVSLQQAMDFCDVAQKTGNKETRNSNINAAMDALIQARGDIVF